MQRSNALLFFKIVLMEKNRVQLNLIVVNIVIEHLIFDISQWQCRRWFQKLSKLIQLLVIEFRPYVTLFTRGMYKHADRFSLVRIVCISPHLWKKFSNDFGNLPLRNEWHRRQFCISTRSFIFRIFQSLNNGEEGSRKSEKDIILRAFFWSLSIFARVVWVPNWYQIWQP